MIRPSVVCLFVLGSLVACGDDTPPAKDPTTATAATTQAPPVVTAEPVQKPAEPTAEEKKKAEAAKALEKDRAEWNKTLDAEKSRWTPEMHTAAKALVDKSFPNGKAAVVAAVSSKHRAPANAARDKARHPVETLEFFGIKPESKVLDIGPGEGWYTEIIAPITSKKGLYAATGGDPNGPADVRGTFYAQKFQGFLSTSPEAYGSVKNVVVDGKAPKLDGTYDIIMIMRGLHGMKNNGTLDAWLGQVKEHLAPNGVLAIEEHRAAPGANVEETSKNGYIPEKWAVETIEAAGFKLAGKSEINANPKDTKDYPKGVWTLPPTLELGDTDKAKYTAIGESDRMTLKFTKKAADAKPATPPAKK